MLKRQRPATPPSSSFGDPVSFNLSDGPIRQFQPLHTTHPSQHRSKRQRIRPPPLDGTLRGLPASESAGTRQESDGEEDWIDDAHDVSRFLLPPSADQYKDANLLLHELHVLNQHRLLFVSSPLPQDRRLEPSNRIPLPTPPTGQRPAARNNGPPYSVPPQLTGELEGQDRCFESPKDEGLVEEVRCVRQRYEGANRLLGSLFLSRRREMGEITSAGPNPSS